MELTQAQQQYLAQHPDSTVGRQDENDGSIFVLKEDGVSGVWVHQDGKESHGRGF